MRTTSNILHHQKIETMLTISKVAVVTGATGQDGAYLAELLLDKGYTVYGTYRRTSSVNFWRMDKVGATQHPNLHLVEFDLTDLSTSIRLLQTAQRSEVYNLAAQSFVGVCFEQPSPLQKLLGSVQSTCLRRSVSSTRRFASIKPALPKCLGKSRRFHRSKPHCSSRAVRMAWPSCMRTG